MKTKDEFKVGKNNISYVDSSFINEFGEDDVNPGSVLKFQKLPRDMKDSEIISELKIQECTIGDILATMNKATDDMKDGFANIFYVKGHSRVVSVLWRGVGWSVDVWYRGSLTWVVGRRVFSPATETSTLSIQDSIPLTLPSEKYTVMLEWLYLNSGNQMTDEFKGKLLEKLKEIL